MCGGLTSVTIPEGVTSIDRDAFYDCNALKTVTIPTSVKYIGLGAFNGCSGLTSLNVSGFDTANVTSMKYMFSGCSSLTRVTLGAGFTFFGAKGAVQCTLPDRDWVAASDGRHYTARQIAEEREFIADTYTVLSPVLPANALRLPANLKTIDAEAFAGVKNVAVYFPACVTGIADDAFDHTVVLVLPDSAWASWASSHGYTYVIRP